MAECRHNIRGMCKCEECHFYSHECLINGPLCSYFMSESDGEEYKTRATEAIQEFLTDITDEMNRKLNECSAKENEMSKCIYNFKGRCENQECTYFHGACNCHSTYECGCYTYMEEKDNDNAVEHPNHYCQGGIECIEAIKASMTPEEFQGYCKGNVEKYVWRWREKAGLQDLKKAQVYLGWLIESVEEHPSLRVNMNNEQ